MPETSAVLLLAVWAGDIVVLVNADRADTFLWIPSTETPAGRPRHPGHASRARKSARDIANLSSRECFVCAITLRDEHWSWASGW